MKRLVYLFVCISVILVLTACTSAAEEDPLTNISIDKDGSVSLRIHESFGEEYYDIAELKEMILDEAAGYNTKNPGAISLDEIAVNEGVTDVHMIFNSPEAYAGYTKELFLLGTCEEMMNSGKVQKVILTGVDDSSNTISETDIATMDDDLLITDCSAIIYLPAKAIFISDNCEVLEGGKSVRRTNNDASPIYVVY